MVRTNEGNDLKRGSGDIDIIVQSSNSDDWSDYRNYNGEQLALIEACKANYEAIKNQKLVELY